jgi:hypothetical protein
MKKKKVGLLAAILLVSFFLSGCANLVRSSYKEFAAVELKQNSSVWDFYGSIQNNKNIMKNDFNTLRGSNSYGYENLYYVLDNQKTLNDVLTNSMVALDLHVNNQANAFFEFADKKNYEIKKGTSSTQYKINYNQNYSFNNVVERDIEVDAILESIFFPTEINLRVQKTQVKEENNILFDTHTISAPDSNEIDNLKVLVNKGPQITGDKEKEVVLTTLYSSTNNSNFKATVTKTIKQDEVVTYKYEKSLELIANSHIKFTVNYDSFGQNKEIIKLLPIYRPVLSNYITFDYLEGSLDWKIVHKAFDDVDVEYTGEAYYQGVNKFLLQEKVSFAAQNKKPLGFEEPYTSQLSIDGDVYNYKYVKGDQDFETLKDMNILKIGIYDNEPQALTFQKTSATSLPEFKRHG